MTQYAYTIILNHENSKFNRELNVNSFESAEKTFDVILTGLKEEIGNFDLILQGNDENKLLRKYTKSY